ncbi:MAG: MoxR family ATPase [Ardenticatenia bacterium]|nr:MoxR family ATPase [Ardenticatena maritima]KPL89126.1 ATPase [Ardenticatena maritima]RME10891.1 MAG: MoxR family ATPase [Ardenticatenia bacterium]
MFQSIDDVKHRLKAANYLASDDIATVVFLADQLGKPLLVEGPAGVGKTELAKAIADALGAELIRLQCYEGLDEAKALYEWQYAKQMLYTQVLRDRVGELLADTQTLREAFERIAEEEDLFFSERFLLPRPLLRALMAEQRPVLLIDEVDKADPEFEAFLLEVLSDFQVSIPELGTIRARTQPFVLLTSNQARELSDALKRRCLHLFINYPSFAEELGVVRMRVPEASEALAAELVAFVQEVRNLALKKVPGLSETLDWARALALLNVHHLGVKEVERTLGVIIKHEGDQMRTRQSIPELLRRAQLRLREWEE